MLSTVTASSQVSAAEELIHVEELLDQGKPDQIAPESDKANKIKKSMFGSLAESLPA